MPSREGNDEDFKSHLLTFGVTDLKRATESCKAGVNTTPDTSSDGIPFIEFPGTWIALYSLQKRAEDISPETSVARDGFSEIPLYYHACNKDEVIEIVSRADSAGARAVKEPQDTFRAGFGGYCTDPDGYYWEVAWGSMFDLKENGEIRFKKTYNG